MSRVCRAVVAMVAAAAGLLVHPGAAGAHEGQLTATLSPPRGPVGTEVIVSGEAPDECISIFVSTPPVGGGPSIIGDTDIAVTDGRYSDAFLVPKTDAAGIVFELRCSRQGVLNLRTEVTFEIVYEAAPSDPDIQDGPHDELAFTGPHEVVLVEAVIGFTMAALGITMTRFARRLRGTAG